MYRVTNAVFVQCLTVVTGRARTRFAFDSVEAYEASLTVRALDDRFDLGFVFDPMFWL